MGSDRQSIWLLRANPKDSVVLRTDLKFFDTHFVGQPMRETWQPPEIRVLNKSKKLRDFLSWMIMAPVVSTKAKAALEPTLSAQCEFLPLCELRGRQYYALNVLAQRDVLDLDGTHMLIGSRGQIMSVSSYAFLRDIEPLPPVFKVPQYASEVFVTRPFVDAVIAEGLTGAAFADPAVDQMARYMRGEPMNVIPGVP